ncbi:hypothetical protein V9K67_11970 [Paraflavisolibacter sp. H34]|uniref:hypothetical protein n=1 Tax=Huijunlia imazamoxiresistens TaxID=3127457 RepID=UPI003019DF56
MKGSLSIQKIASAIFLMFLLAWLTVSTPFIYSSQQIKKELAKKQCEKVNCDDPISRTTEEKAESGINTLSEYLHEHGVPERGMTMLIVRYFKCHPADLYFAFHPELLSPPPEA